MPRATRRDRGGLINQMMNGQEPPTARRRNNRIITNNQIDNTEIPRIIVEEGMPAIDSVQAAAAILEQNRIELERETTLARFNLSIEPIILNWGTATITNTMPSGDDGIVYLNTYGAMGKSAGPDENGMVMTADGKECKVEDCINIHGGYFRKDDDRVAKCFYSGDYDLKDYMLKAIKELTIDDKGKKTLVHAHYCKKYNDRLIPVYSEKYGFDYLLLTTEFIKGWDYREDNSTGGLVDIGYKKTDISQVKHYDTFKNYYSSLLNEYNAEVRDNRNIDGEIIPKDYTRIAELKKKLISLGIISPTYLITEGMKYTFGVELEMSRGFIPKWKAAQGLNISCVRDGSIDGGAGNGGPEIVTGILTGDTGINHLQQICTEASKRTLVNHTCGVHLHIGGVEFSKKVLINTYRLALILEKEIFSTLPKSRRGNAYCKPLKRFNFRPAIGDTQNNLIEIEEDYNALFKYMSVEKANNPDFNYNKDKQHPMGPKCGYNRDTPRYCWLNYVPAMFNTRTNGSYSIEVRNHSATTNFTKIKNWLLFFMAFMSFAENHRELIVPGLKMDDVIYKMLPKKAKNLSLYFNSRKAAFEDDNNESREYTTSSQEDVKSIKELII